MSPGVRCTRQTEHSFLGSAIATEGRFIRTAAVTEWLESRRHTHRFVIKRVPFRELESWGFDSATGNLRHASGRFFTVEGLHVTTDYPRLEVFSQPIINQPEIGILGILAKSTDGVLHFLIQAKMEPGNVNLVQLSPTVQATKSNYTRVHRGASPRYLEYFLERGRGRTLVDILQSEQGSFFLRKRNRNMIVVTEEDVPPHEDFCWMTLGQLKQMLLQNNLVNMDTRTVLSLIPIASSEAEIEGLGLGPRLLEGTGFAQDLVASSLAVDGRLHVNDDIISWLTELKAMAEIQVCQVPLNSLSGWHRDQSSIRRDDGRCFSIIAISVEADTREVRGWGQPIVHPSEQGITGFLVKKFEGLLHFLVQGRMEPGTFDMIEMAPTVQYLPGSTDSPPPFLEVFLTPPPGNVRYETIQSEEGGRFFHYQNRNIVVELDDSCEVEAPHGYIWMTLGQINSFLRYNNYFNIEARGLLACLGLGAL